MRDSILLLIFTALVFVILPGSSHAQGNNEAACYHDLYQGGLAWNQSGTTEWTPENIALFCTNVANYQGKKTCFQNSIAAGTEWNQAAIGCTGIGLIAPPNHSNIVPDWQKAGSISASLLDQFEAKFYLMGLSKPIDSEIDDTFSIDTQGLFFTDHVQGMAWSSIDHRFGNQIYAITHDLTWASRGNLLVLCNDSNLRTENDNAKCFHHILGEDLHPGGAIQMVGAILLTSDESNNAQLYDVRDISRPLPMPCKFPDNPGGAAGIVWHEQLNVHVARFQQRFFVSNGKPLDNPDCRFSYAKVEAPNNWPGAAGEGLSQLFYDHVNNQIIGIGGHDQRIDFQRYKVFRNAKSEIVVKSFDDPKTSKKEGYGKTFFQNTSVTTVWGATMRLAGDHMSLVVAERELSSGAGLNPDLNVHIFHPPQF